MSAYDLGSGRETVTPGTAANLLQIHPDFPNIRDAWDVDAFHRNTVTDLTDADEVAAETSAESGAVAVRVARSFGESTAVRVLSLRPGSRRPDIDTEVDWHETEKFLKLSFPLDVHSERYASETQFGHYHRPTRTNTSWEAATFEAEPGWGVALVTDSTYGHDVTRQVREEAEGGDGGTTTLRASLPRAPRFPAPETDQGVHRFRRSLVPGATIGDAGREGYRVNLPERGLTGAGEAAPLVAFGDDVVVVTAGGRARS